VSEAGPGWQSPVHSWRLEQCPYAPARGHEFGIRRWKTLRALKAAALACRLWKGLLVPSKTRSATEGWVGRAARQGASGVWSTTSCKADKAEREGRRAERNSLGPRSGRRQVDDGLQLARAVPSAAPLEVGWPSWSFGASVYGKDRSRAGKAVGEKGRPRKRRSAGCELCARERGFPRVLVTTVRLQRLVRDIFSPVGGPASSDVGGTPGSSDIAAAVTVTGRPVLRCATRVPRVVDSSD
jgi:hypothetical protein